MEHTYNDIDVLDAIIHYRTTLENGVKQSDKHMDGFLRLCSKTFQDNNMTVREKHKAVVSGGILHKKRWDLVASGRRSCCALEFKSILSSRFGRNYSSRVEEAIGVGYDAKAKSKATKLGYWIILEDDDGEAHKHREKIKTFCNTIMNKYKIYDSVIAIELNQDNWDYIYSDYKSFINKFDSRNIFDIFRLR